MPAKTQKKAAVLKETLTPADVQFIKSNAGNSPAHLAAACQATVEAVLAVLPYCVLYRGPWADKGSGKLKGGYYYINYHGQQRLLSAKEPTPEGEAFAWEERSKFLTGDKAKVVADPVANQAAKDSTATVNDLVAFFFQKTQVTEKARKGYQDSLCNFCTGYATVGTFKKKDTDSKRHKGFGEVPLNEIKRSHVREWWDANPTWSENSCRTHYAALRAAFSLAVQDEKFGLEHSPVHGVKLPVRPRAEKPKHLSAKDMKKVLQTITGEFETFVTANLELGTRPGELAKITPRHVVEMDGEYYFVLSPAEWKNGRKQKKDRIIPITGQWVGYVKERVADIENDDYVFVTPKGKPWNQNYWAEHWDTVRTKCKLPKGTPFYALRHTHITQECDNGVDRELLAEKCGTSVTMVKSIYDHGDRFLRVRSAVRKAK